MEYIELGHSPDINAEEHAWPWIRRHITKDFSPSICEDECQVINKWIDSIPNVVRKIIKYHGDNCFHDGRG
ncbi:hypothetical protein GQ44DRAFT_706227 [Phaeosphaeriaceae sp. PMI808]|nr:hypothetical protein GQ44DRAFT_706227 [Phaeosphaeriaceae sp. PMI808]